MFERDNIVSEVDLLEAAARIGPQVDARDWRDGVYLSPEARGMKRRAFLSMGGALIALVASRSMAEETKAPRRIGVLLSGTPGSAGKLVDEFRLQLRSFGYLEGRDVVIDVRWAESKLERLAPLAAELLSSGLAVILTSGSAAVAACQHATSTVPIVFASAGDPIGQGFVKSYSHPGGNITGVAFNEEINKKIYELVRSVLPKASRIAILVNENNPAQEHHLADVPTMARALHFEPVLVHATQEQELEAAIEQALKARAHALVVTPLAPFTGLYPRLIALQHKHRIPMFSGYSTFVPAGGLAAYYFPIEENWHRAAALVDKILKGANPADIPVERPMRYEIAINLKAAKSLGIPIPQSVLFRAGKVIE